MIYSNVEEIEAAAAEHQKNFDIIRGSMPSKPSPDDFAMEERAQRELRLAQDARALAASHRK